MKAFYSIRDYDHRYALETRCNVERPIEAEDFAQEAAADFHSSYDGWEYAWPIEFTIYAEKDGPAVGHFDVEREMEPVFYAYSRALAASSGAEEKS